MNKIAFSTNFQIMIKKLLLFPLTLILLSSCSYHFSSKEAGTACDKWEWVQKEELRKKGKDIDFVRDFLDERFPLLKTSWREVSRIQIEENKLVLFYGSNKDYLKNNDQFVGFNGDKENPSSILI